MELERVGVDDEDWVVRDLLDAALEGGLDPPRGKAGPGLVSAVLLRGAKLVEKGWTRFAWARDSADLPLESVADAASWCATGALVKASVEIAPADALDACAAAVEALAERVGVDGPVGVIQWNDGSTAAEDVAAALRGAADDALAEGR